VYGSPLAHRVEGFIQLLSARLGISYQYAKAIKFVVGEMSSFFLCGVGHMLPPIKALHDKPLSFIGNEYSDLA
jgi:hypothetical protein